MTLRWAMRSLPDLARQRARFVAFAGARVRDASLAEELVQRAYAKAAAHVGELDDPAKADAWFFQVLRNVITDAARRDAVEQRSLGQLDGTAEQTLPGPAILNHRPCDCVGRAFASLDASKTATLNALVVEEERIPAFAERTGQTANVVSVRLHRARAALKDRILELCGPCCAQGCGACACP